MYSGSDSTSRAMKSSSRSLAETITSMPSVASSTRIEYSNLNKPFSRACEWVRISAKADPASTSTFMKRANSSGDIDIATARERGPVIGSG